MLKLELMPKATQEIFDRLKDDHLLIVSPWWEEPLWRFKLGIESVKI